jgi:cytochrome c556
MTADGTDAIAGRVAYFREIGTAFKHVNDELSAKQPDFARIRESAQLIKSRAAEMRHWFPPGSEPRPPAEQSWIDTLLGWLGLADRVQLPDDAKTRAKIEAWTKPQQFNEAHRAFALEADKFWHAARGGESAVIASRAQALGKTCEGCHKQFREEED